MILIEMQVVQQQEGPKALMKKTKNCKGIEWEMKDSGVQMTMS